MYFSKFGGAILTLAAVLSSLSPTTLACTTIMVGKNVSSDGSIIIARLEDYTTNNHPKRFVVVPRKDNERGRQTVL